MGKAMNVSVATIVISLELKKLSLDNLSRFQIQKIECNTIPLPGELRNMCGMQFFFCLFLFQRREVKIY